MSVDLDILTRPFPAEAIKSRPIPGMGRASYVDGATVIRRLNEATGNTWSMTVDRYWEENGKTLALVTLAIPGCGSRQHIGVQSSDGKSGEDAGAKGAITDALKKAATLFGVGLDLYGPDHEHSSGDSAASQNRQLDVSAPSTVRSSNSAPAPPKVSAANRLLSREPAPWAQHLKGEQVVTDTGEIVGTVASEKQQKFAKSLVFKQWDGDFATFDAMTAYVFGSDLYALTSEQVSAIIDYLQKSTTTWTDPRQLGLRIEGQQPATTQETAPPPTTSLAERVRAEDPAAADARNAEAWARTMERQQQEDIAADDVDAQLEATLGESAQVNGFRPHDMERANADYEEFLATLATIKGPTGKKSSAALAAVQAWQREKGYRDNPRFQQAWAAAIDRINKER